MPLPDELTAIGQRLVEWFKRPSGSTDAAPYHVYVYPPNKEWDVRRDLGELAAWLAKSPREVPSLSISLADVLWRAIDESGWTDELFSQEREAAHDSSSVDEDIASVLAVVATGVMTETRAGGDVRDKRRTAVRFGHLV
ncbi:MAG TPA: hypothetical protein VM282_08220 [Acidimicrobiales bacterium]|nr:hypothetical protein [Acidimicrobiales bacterium]